MALKQKKKRANLLKVVKSLKEEFDKYTADAYKQPDYS